jgi:hypothetical protein
VPLCGHNARRMFTADSVLALLFRSSKNLSFTRRTCKERGVNGR